jgi:hypothetical protein
MMQHQLSAVAVVLLACICMAPVANGACDDGGSVCVATDLGSGETRFDCYNDESMVRIYICMYI